MTVSIEGETSDLSSIPGCKHGDTVKLESTGFITLYELAIIKKPGNSSQCTFSWFFSNTRLSCYERSILAKKTFLTSF